MGRKPKRVAGDDDGSKPVEQPSPPWGVDWFEEQLTAKQTNRKKLSLHHKPGSENWLKKIIEGTQYRRVSDVVFLANYFGVAVNDVIRALGFECPGPVAAVVGTVGDDCRVREIPKRERRTIPAPPDEFGLYANLSAVHVTGSLMPPAYRNAHLLFAPDAPRNSGILHRVCVVTLAGETAPVVGYVEPTNRAHVAQITPINPTVDPLQAAHFSRASPVLWVKH